MSLLDDAFDICKRLAPNGLRSLLLNVTQQALDIDQPNAVALRVELLKALSGIDRSIRGFEDFSPDGVRAIEPGLPARSLLFHALASPGVVDLTEFPTHEELEALENLVFGIAPPTLADVRARSGADLAVVVFVREYRPAKDTPLRTHADHAFARTGVARVGTRAARWDGRNRGYRPDVDSDPFAFHVCPAPYAAYLAVNKKGTHTPLMRPHASDAARDFWVPVHKLFSGKECLHGLDLKVEFDAFHMNDKIRRTRTVTLQLPDVPTTAPFRITSGIAKVSSSGVVTPKAHPRLVEPATVDGKLLTYRVPSASPGFAALEPGAGNIGGMEVRPAPAYVHARTKVVGGQRIDLSEAHADLNAAVGAGGYDALHYTDVTGEGFVDAKVTGLDGHTGLSGQSVPAYSLVSAPDFYPSAGQRELFERMPEEAWGVPPNPLCDTRLPANLQIPNNRFTASDKTVTAVVGLLNSQKTGTTRPVSREAQRHSALPDDCAGVFAPGWDISTDVSSNDVHHLAAYGLGSPFPEDAKLCAALSTFWPAVAPDAARGMSPHTGNSNLLGTVAPLTDEELGQIGTLPWDGVSGPTITTLEGQEVVECASFLHVDYVRSALEGRFTLRLTAQVDADEFSQRMKVLALAYAANSLDRNELRVLSFREVLGGDPELQRAQTDTSTVLSGAIYRIELIKGGPSTVSNHPTDHRKKLLPIRRRESYFASEAGVALRKRANQSVWVRVP